MRTDIKINYFIHYRVPCFLQVRVFTFAVGPPAESTEALREMACNNRGEHDMYYTAFPPNTFMAAGKESLVGMIEVELEDDRATALSHRWQLTTPCMVDKLTLPLAKLSGFPS